VAAVLMFVIVRTSIDVVDGGNHLHYSASLEFGGLTQFYMWSYLRCSPLSSDRVVVMHGGVNLAAVAALAALLATGTISLWCLWAAVTSIAVAIHLRRIHGPHSIKLAFATS
jgi:hypothetical protein